MVWLLLTCVGLLGLLGSYMGLGLSATWALAGGACLIVLSGGTRAYLHRNAERQDAPDKLLRLALDQQRAQAREAGYVWRGLPTYVAIGAPHSGKSALLDALGFHGNAPLVPGQDALPCRLWISASAACVEANGHYSTEQAPHHAWATWARTICQRVGARRLAGVLVTLDARALIAGGTDAGAVAVVRQQLMQLLKISGRDLPVYVLVTHTDCVAGFAETFAELDEAGRQQSLGFVIDERERTAPRAAVQQHLLTLVQALRNHATLRLSAQMAPEARQPTYLFPQHFSQLGEALEQTVQHLFGAAGFARGPMLRGLYFCSTGQELSAGWAAPGANMFPYAMEPRTQAQGPYFCKSIRDKVLYHDLKTPPRITRRGPWGTVLRRPAASVATLVALAVMGLQGHAWWSNRRMLLVADEAVQKMKHALSQTAGDDEALTELRLSVQRL